MKSKTTKRFRSGFNSLPKSVQRQAREAYRLFKNNPYHPSLNFKQVDSKQRIYSVRISLHYRAVGRWVGDEVIWFWIGSHAEYDKILSEN